MSGMAIFWLVLLILFLMAEGATAAVTTIWFAAGALVAMLAALFEVKLLLQITLFILVSVVLLLGKCRKHDLIDGRIHIGYNQRRVFFALIKECQIRRSKYFANDQALDVCFCGGNQLSHQDLPAKGPDTFRPLPGKLQSWTPAANHKEDGSSHQRADKILNHQRPYPCTGLGTRNTQDAGYQRTYKA